MKICTFLPTFWFEVLKVLVIYRIISLGEFLDFFAYLLIWSTKSSCYRVILLREILDFFAYLLIWSTKSSCHRIILLHEFLDFFCYLLIWSNFAFPDLLVHSGCLGSKNFLSTIDAPPGIPWVSKNHIFFFTNETVFFLR